MDAIRAVTFDLDNSLWDIFPVLERAEAKSHRYIESRFPKIAQRHTVETIRELRERLFHACPDIQCDFTKLRKKVYEHLLDESDYDVRHAQALLDKFLEDRNRVELYPDVLPALRRLSGKLPLVSLSDGNACLDTIGIGHYFVGRVHAADIGVLKPDPQGFLKACELAGHAPGEVLHVGDHPRYDMYGARKVGMKTMWLDRPGEYAPKWDQQFEPDYHVNSLAELVELIG